jgi:AraC family transcriptional regulator, regulatory protein of adaptative response / methylated-DNA-[protein]-cysteine methyltransferase
MNATETPPISLKEAMFETNESRWDAVRQRDAAADGRFYYSVRTTGVYCKPSCKARPALRENVAFHNTPEDAERAGFRPCKRCRPDNLDNGDPNAPIVEAACRMIETADELPTLSELASQAGFSDYHFHRVFKQLTGVTPRAYAAEHRAKRVRERLTESGTITSAIYEAGFNSSGRFYEGSSQLLGMTPTAFRKGGAGSQIRFAVGECSLGSILVAATEKGVCAIQFGDDPDQLVRDLQDRFPQATLEGNDVEFEKTIAQVVGFIEAPQQGLDMPLDVRGTAFQHKVWQALRKIPAGKTASYGDIAKQIGMPSAVRAIAQACAANPTAVAIPCHRVVRTDGNISGYRWGVERKRQLLAREGALR